MEEYLIWSIEHNMWCSNHCGYTTEVSCAGAYNKKEAKDIVDGANRNGAFCECMIPVEQTRHTEGMVVDIEKVKKIIDNPEPDEYGEFPWRAVRGTLNLASAIASGDILKEE